MSITAGEFICVGCITGARGLNGEVRVKVFTTDPKGIANYGDVFDEQRKVSYQLEVTGQAKGQLLVRLSGVEDRCAAEALKGTSLYVKKSDLPILDEDEFYFCDLEGLRVDLVNGDYLGKINGVHDFGAGAILEIVCDGLEPVMVPFSKAIVPIVDKKGGKIVVDPPIGLLELSNPVGKEKK